MKPRRQESVTEFARIFCAIRSFWIKFEREFRFREGDTPLFGQQTGRLARRYETPKVGSGYSLAASSIDRSLGACCFAEMT